MAGLSDYLEAAFAGWINGTPMPSPPANRYIGLFNGDPTDAGSGGQEMTTTLRPGGRVTGTFQQTVGVLINSADVDFSAAQGSATLSHFGIFDAASGGNLLMHGALTGGAQTIGAGTNVKFPAGSLIAEIR